MKKTIVSFVLANSIALASFAQLKVNSVGNVGIGTQNVESMLSVGDSNPLFTSCFGTNNGLKNMLIKNTNIGLTIQNDYSQNQSSTGILVIPNSGSSNSMTVGVLAYTGISSNINYGLCSAIPPVPNGSNAQAAIYGSSTSNLSMQHTG